MSHRVVSSDVVSLSGHVRSPAARTPTSKAAGEPHLTLVSASGRRPAELDDRDWLLDRYERDGDIAIAEELGVARLTVQRARHRLGIPTRAPGRRRGVSRARETHPTRAAELITLRIREQTSPHRSADRKPAPTDELLATRFRAVNDAWTDGDQHTLIQEVIELAAACGVLVDRLLREAAA